MNSRRSFFKRLAAVVAAVAIAPEIAFRTKLELPEVEAEPTQGYLYVSYKKSEDGSWKREYFREADASQHADDNCVMVAQFDPMIPAPVLEAIHQQLPALKLTYSLSSAPRS